MLANSYIGVENAKPEIVALTKKTAESQFKIGEILLGLKKKVESFKTHKDGWKKKDSPYQVAKMEYNNLVTSELPFGKVVANKLVQIASDKGIKKHLDKIPFAYNTMYDLVGMSTKQWNFYFKNGLDGKSTANDIKEMKKKWLAKEQPKDETPTASTEQEVQENQAMLDKMGVGAKTTLISDELSDEIKEKFEFGFAEPSIAVKVIESDINTEQYTSLVEILNEVIDAFFKDYNVNGKFEVSVNPHVLSDDPKYAKAA